MEALTPRELARRIRLAKAHFETASQELEALMLEAENYIDEPPNSITFLVSYKDILDDAELIAKTLEEIEPEESLQDQLDSNADINKRD